MLQKLKVRIKGPIYHFEGHNIIKLFMCQRMIILAL